MMKLHLFAILTVMTLVLSVPAHAAKPRKHPQPNAASPPVAAPQPQPPAPPQQALAPDALPSVALQPFLNAHLDIILAPLDTPGFKHPNAITDLHSSIADAMSKAPPAKQPAFQAALAVCGTLSRAYDDREAAVANLQGSTAVHSQSSLGVVNTRRLTRKQLHSENRAKQDAAQTDAFFVNAQKNQWVQRAAQWRRSVQQLYLREREIERQVNAPAAAPAATPAPAATGVH